jgi:hypothetical protein
MIMIANQYLRASAAVDLVQLRQYSIPITIREPVIVPLDTTHFDPKRGIDENGTCERKASMTKENESY